MTRTGFPARLSMLHQNRRLNSTLRRNGKPQSCEPCRKGKLRCDHMMPTCGRCARRGKPEQCVYHPAPLTKATTLATPQATSTEGSTSSPVIHSYECQSTSNTALQFPPFDELPYLSRVPRASSLPSQPWSSIIYGQPTVEELRRPLPNNETQGVPIGEQGFVHHHAIIAENELSVGISPPHFNATSTSKITQAQIDRGATVLSLLKDLPLLEKYIEKWFSFMRGIVLIEPMVKIWTSGLWSRWHKVLEASKTGDLRQMSLKIWENTLITPSSLLHRHASPRDFCAKTTGDNLRWEVVGIIFTIVAMLAKSLQNGDPIFCSHDSPPVDREALAMKCFNASSFCVGFCTDYNLVNDVFLWLLYENTILYCEMHIAGSYTNWQKTGYLTTALLSYGLHNEIKVNDSTPFFIAEFRKRLLVCVYSNDKYAALFHGRPPHLTRHYCRIQLPLDLTDAQTMSDNPELESTFLNLDNGGWNKRGVVESSTYARILASNSLITEEILEISLGVLEPEELVRRAADIEARAIQLWNNFPPFLKIDTDRPWDVKCAPIELMFLSDIRLSDLCHHFVLQRTLIKKVGAESTKLLAVSREIFSFIMIFVNNKDTLRDFQMDFIMILCMPGIPAAAVIAVELLHQEQNPTSPSTLSNPLPRSETIQNLSVFVACLANTRTYHGGPSCARGKQFLGKILDTILSPRPVTEVRTESAGDLGSGFDAGLFQAWSDGEFMRWLETMEWEPESWVNYGQ